VKVNWLAEAEAGVPVENEWLSEGELTALAGLRFPKRRADWRLGRWTAKRAIAAHLKLTGGLPSDHRGLAAIEIRPAPSGAPEAFVAGGRADLTLSLSHSDGTAFCVLGSAGASLGCDVEKVVPHSAAFAADYFTTGEQDLVAGSPVDDRDIMLTLLWSAKESALKALQCGLRSDTRDVAVEPAGLPPSNHPAWRPLTASHAGGQVFHGWWRLTGAMVWTLVAIPAPLEVMPL
jgi:4'-phosphopantetheinyl transferase